MAAYYFGCTRGVWGDTQAGHGFCGPHGRSVSGRDVEAANPWGMLDGKLAPKDHYGEVVFGIDDRRRAERAAECPQGVAALHHKDGWTALSFWDRTGDSRDNSNSTFLFDAALSFDEAVAATREHFPALFARFTFEVVAHESSIGARP